MEKVLSLFDPINSIVLVIIFAIVAGIYFYMSKTPLELLIATPNERFRYHMWGILSVSSLYFVIATIIIAFTPVTTKETEIPPLTTAPTETSIAKVVFENISFGGFLFCVFVVTYIITVIVYIVMHIINKLTEKNYYYQITIDNIDYKIMKGLSNNRLLLRKRTPDNLDVFQIANLESVNLTDIQRVKK